MRQTNVERAAEHARRNREAAAVILAAPARYGGPDSLLAQWARRALERREESFPLAPDRLPQQGRLFRDAAG